MTDTTTSIELLQQRLAAAEQWRADDAAKIEGLANEAAELRGRMGQQERANQSQMKLVGPIASIVFALIVGFVGYSITGRIDQLEAQKNSTAQVLAAFQSELKHVKTHTDIDGHPEKVNARIDVMGERLDNLESKKSASASSFDDHIKSFAHPEARDALTKVMQRLDTFDREQVARSSRLGHLEQSLVALQSDNRALRAGIDEHEEEIDSIEEKVSAVQKSIASTQASTGAAFVEVETQIRAWVDTSNLRAAYQHSQMQQLSNLVDPENPIPDLEFFPQRIPAQAMTTVGKINGSDGN